MAFLVIFQIDEQSNADAVTITDRFHDRVDDEPVGKKLRLLDARFQQFSHEEKETNSTTRNNAIKEISNSDLLINRMLLFANKKTKLYNETRANLLYVNNRNATDGTSGVKSPSIFAITGSYSTEERDHDTMSVPTESGVPGSNRSDTSDEHKILTFTDNSSAVLTFTDGSRANSSAILTFTGSNRANSSAILAFTKSNRANSSAILTVADSNRANSSAVLTFTDSNRANSSVVLPVTDSNRENSSGVKKNNGDGNVTSPDIFDHRTNKLIDRFNEIAQQVCI